MVGGVVDRLEIWWKGQNDYFLIAQATQKGYPLPIADCALIAIVTSTGLLLDLSITLASNLLLSG